MCNDIYFKIPKRGRHFSCILCIFIYICCIFNLDSVFIGGNAQNYCQDVDQTACGVFKTADPKMCDNPCLADLCKDTCGFCRKIINTSSD